jgi:hypothetical protein
LVDGAEVVASSAHLGERQVMKGVIKIMKYCCEWPIVRL